VRYRVTHRTAYRYESVVSSSYGQLHLLPRDLRGQLCHSAEIHIDPEATELREHRDYFGNRTTYFSVLRPHTELALTSVSVVEVNARPPALSLLVDDGWEQVREQLRTERTDELLDARQFTLDSPLVATHPALAEYAQPSFPPARPLTEAIAALSARINEDFDYQPGATSVTTTIDELLARREGVCQDFAHFAIGCLRSLGLAARYVSGYLETEPPPGRPKLQGADVSHAWTSVFVPALGWVDLDPTNQQFVNDRYVTIAWGRDYADVPPVKGVIYTEGATDELIVQVDVVPIADDE
jgi:transglutaminase-like putative cysteine protease